MEPVVRRGDRYDMSVSFYQLMVVTTATCGLLIGLIVGLALGAWAW